MSPCSTLMRLRLYWTHYAPPQIQRILFPAPRCQPFKKEMWPPHLLDTTGGLRLFLEWGPHFSMASITPTAVAGRGALALRFSPKRSKETLAAINSLPHPLNNRLFLRHSGFLQPHWRDLHDQATRLDFVNWWSAQCILFYVSLSLPFPAPFSSILLPWDCTPQWSAAQSFNTDSFSSGTSQTLMCIQITGGPG